MEFILSQSKKNPKKQTRKHLMTPKAKENSFFIFFRYTKQLTINV